MGAISLWKTFNYLRYSAGIALVVNGWPLVFFIRDTLRIGPASNVFTAFFFGFSLLLMFPTHLFVRLYKVNFTLLKYGVLFLLVALYHFVLFNNSGVDWFVEMGNYVFIFAFLFLIIHVSNEVKDTLLPIIFLLTFLCNLTLIYSLLTDPNWHLGMRAAVTFGNENAQEGGNPHVTARNGLVCMISGLVLAGKYRNPFIRIFIFASVLLSLALVVLSQSRSALLALGLMVGMFFLFNAKAENVSKMVKGLFSIRSLVVIVLLYIALKVFLAQFSSLEGTLYGYWFTFYDKMINIAYTAFGIKLTETATIDHSAMGRVTSFSYFNEALAAPALLLIGGGYKSSYMDVPVLESLINHGIFGFIFFGGLVVYILIYTLKEARNPTNNLTLFLAYFYIYLFVMLCTGGRPYDLFYWFPLIMYIRFFNIKYLNHSKKILHRQPELA